MAYDEQLAEHIREVIAREHGLSKKRMFGGQAFLLNGNLAVSASGQGGLLLRVDPVQTETLIADPNASRAVMGGREVNGWLRIRTDALTDADSNSGSTEESRSRAHCHRNKRLLSIRRHAPLTVAG